MPLEKTYKIGICLLCIALIVSSFLFAEFTLIKSEYSAHSNVETFAFGNPEVYANEMYLHIEEGNARLEEELVAMLQKEGIITFRSATLKENYGNDVLLVTILEEEKTYTPVYSKTSEKILFFYSIAGTTKYFNEFKSGESPVVKFSSEDGDQMIIKGIVTVTDTSKGLMSLKGYDGHVAEKIAQEIVMQLTRQLERKG